MTTLPSVGPEYSVSFDLLVDKHTYHPGVSNRNVLHLTTENDCCNLGDRVPGVWLNNDDNTLHITSAVNNVGDYIYDHRVEPLKEGQWYKIQIQQVKRNAKVDP